MSTSLSSSSLDNDHSATAHEFRPGKNMATSVYGTILAGQSCLITVTWRKNVLLHGLSLSLQGPDQHGNCCYKVEFSTWFSRRKEGSEQLLAGDKTVDLVWDLMAANFNGQIEPQSNYYIAIACDQELVLLLGNLEQEAFTRTGCSLLLDPLFVSRKDHLSGKKLFLTRNKFHKRRACHEISVDCYNDSSEECDPHMEIRIDGNLVLQVRHLQWNFRGNEFIDVEEAPLGVCWDVHGWLFSPELRHSLAIFQRTPSPPSPPPALAALSPLSSSLGSTILPSPQPANSTAGEECPTGNLPGFFVVSVYMESSVELG
ncbi:uncharacterized protein LOC127809269 [Diospyros lotus]|uniref:uncharacterized protein LOC127809269 n=1 Tax=Diospyros lotus TaxID=55363 RepID=UPI00224F2C91|nr:uncharacterized protein LOC127809269 [Diospyros lotus]